MKERHLLSAILLALLLLGSWPITTAAQTPDRVTPANEGVCEGLKAAGVTSGLYGLCVSYCEALDCPDPSVGPKKLSAQCRAQSPTILEAYKQRKTAADPAMPCVKPPGCPCWSAAEIAPIGLTYTPNEVANFPNSFPSYSTFALVENRTATNEFPYGAYQLVQIDFSDVNVCRYFNADFAPGAPAPVIRVQEVTNSEAAACKVEIDDQLKHLNTSGVNVICAGNLCE